MYTFKKVRVATLVDRMLTELFGVEVTKKNFKNISVSCQNKWVRYRYFQRIFRSMPIIIVDSQTRGLVYYDSYTAFDNISGYVLVKWSDISHLFKDELMEDRPSMEHLVTKVLTYLNTNHTNNNDNVNQLVTLRTPFIKPTLLNRTSQKIVRVKIQKPLVKKNSSAWLTHKNTYKISKLLNAHQVKPELLSFISKDDVGISPKQNKINNEKLDEIIDMILFMHNSDNRVWLVKMYESNDQSLNAKHFPAYDILAMLIRNNALPTQKQRESINNRLLYKKFKIAPYTELIKLVSKENNL